MYQTVGGMIESLLVRFLKGVFTSGEQSRTFPSLRRSDRLVKQDNHVDDELFVPLLLCGFPSRHPGDRDPELLDFFDIDRCDDRDLRDERLSFFLRGFLALSRMRLF